MKCPIILSLTAAFFFSTTANASRTLILMGGGGEPKNMNTTIFDETLNSMDKYLQNNKWNSLVSFNGGHSQTEAIMNMKFNDAQNKSSFTPNNYNAIIKAYEDQIKSGQMKAGDQLMLMIDTHGAVRSDNENTHQIAVGQAASQTSLNDLGGTTTLSLDSLKNLAALAKEKGVKLAILDFSCHSGNTLNLANDNTCVISSTGTKHFGYTGFSDNFIGRMKAGKSLEDVFLDTRKNTKDNSFPMISTAAGTAINRDFYPDITPYLYYYEKDPHVDKMTNYILQTAATPALCARQNQYDDLLKQLESLRAASTLNMNKNLPEINKIKSLIADYKAKQDRYIDLLRSWGTPELNRREQFVGVGTVGRRSEKMTTNYSWQEILDSDFDTIIKNVTNAKNSTRDASTQAQFQASIDMHTKARAKQQEILSQYPNLKGYKQNIHKQLEEMQGTYAIANQIAMEERKLYDNMYANLRQEKKQTPNPCKDFVL